LSVSFEVYYSQDAFGSYGAEPKKYDASVFYTDRRAAVGARSREVEGTSRLRAPTKDAEGFGRGKPIRGPNTFYKLEKNTGEMIPDALLLRTGPSWTQKVKH